MFAEAILPSACNPISVLLSPATATATMLLPLVKRFRVVSPTADQKTTEPSARVAKLPVELPVTAMTLLNPGGGASEGNRGASCDGRCAEDFDYAPAGGKRASVVGGCGAWPGSIGNRHARVAEYVAEWRRDADAASCARLVNPPVQHRCGARDGAAVRLGARAPRDKARFVDNVKGRSGRGDGRRRFGEIAEGAGSGAGGAFISAAGGGGPVRADAR